MKKTFLTLLVVCMCVTLMSSSADARKAADRFQNLKMEKMTHMKASPTPGGLNSAADQGTTFLGYWEFDSGPSCVNDGWVSHDLTTQLDDFVHVDDFAGLGGGTFGLLVPLEGTKSLWIGARPDGGSLVLCGYASLPGYGSNWDQILCSSCLNVSGDVTFAYTASWDSEPGYDQTFVEYDADCNGSWASLGSPHDVQTADSTETFTIADSLHSGTIAFRFHFIADGAWSDEDGLWDTDGGFIVDAITVDDAGGSVDSENFESAAVGDHGAGVWSSCNQSGYGDLSALYPGLTVLQEDPCLSELSCVWTFYTGSTDTYACGGFPGTAAVPKGNALGQYLWNEVWSPQIPWIGSGGQAEFTYNAYRDLPLDNLVFFLYGVRSIVGGCPGPWLSDNTVYYGEDKDWLNSVYAIGDKIAPGATHIQLSMGAIDMCGFWCGLVGSGACHSQAPLLDKALAYRIGTPGPGWQIQPWRLFQDNFSEDGTTTGVVRIDQAQDILPSSNPSILIGDSLACTVADPVYGLATDPHTGTGPAVYMYAAVWPQGQPGKSGSALTQDATRWPVVDSTTGPNGATWYCIRMDSARVQNNTSVSPDNYCVDLNDNLFTPGDTICYFLAAASDDGSFSTSYFHGGFNNLDNIDATGAILVTTDINVAFANVMEVTCLPTGAGDILYVDHGDGRSVQPFFDTAFDQLGILDEVDRFDVRAPSSGVANSLGTRVQDVFQQIIGPYKKIIWNSEELDDGSIGDGTGTPDKSDDFSLLFTFLDQDTDGPGLYLSGDNIGTWWSGLAAPAAVALKGTYMNFNLITNDHKTLGLGIAPLVIGESGSCFDHVIGPDTVVAYGGCPQINRFDVLQPTGLSVMEASYSGNGTDGAIISQTTANSAGSTARVMFQGFSFDLIADDRPAGNIHGVADRIHLLYDIIIWLQNTPSVPVSAPKVGMKNTLAQNYPNPFNPTTTINFTLRETSRVQLNVFNVAGQLVRTLVDENRAGGSVHTIQWDGRNDLGQTVSSGVYFYKLVAGDFVQTKKMVLLK